MPLYVLKVQLEVGAEHARCPSHHPCIEGASAKALDCHAISSPCAKYLSCLRPSAGPHARFSEEVRDFSPRLCERGRQQGIMSYVELQDWTFLILGFSSPRLHYP